MARYRSRSANRSGRAARGVRRTKVRRTSAPRRSTTSRNRTQTVRIVIDNLGQSNALAQNGLTVAPAATARRKARF